MDRVARHAVAGVAVLADPLVVIGVVRVAVLGPGLAVTVRDTARRGGQYFADLRDAGNRRLAGSGVVAGDPPLVDPLPIPDQGPVPSALVACTCTSYSVSSSRLPIVVLVAVILLPALVQPASYPTPGAARHSRRLVRTPADFFLLQAAP